MSKVIGIMGESGSGKTTSMRNLDPKSTYYIDCDKKGLSWKGWREQYNKENNNYYCTDYVQIVQQILGNINEKAPHIKTVVIDTLNGLMVADEVRRMKEKGFDKWQDLAQCVWNLLDGLYSYRDDLTIIVICHSQTQKEDDGYTFTRIKTSGKKLDKLNVESKGILGIGRFLFNSLYSLGVPFDLILSESDLSLSMTIRQGLLAGTGRAV